MSDCLNRQFWIVKLFAIIGAGTVIYWTFLMVRATPYNQVYEDIWYFVQNRVLSEYQIPEAIAATGKFRKVTDKATEAQKPVAEVESQPIEDNALVAEAPKEEEKTQAQPARSLSAIAGIIYRLESSGGRNDGCREKGLYNGYGFRQNKSEFKCFSSREEVRGLVIDWFKQHLHKEKLTLPEALCHYNIGEETEDCKYYRDYLALSK